jgi:HEAT repeat protein
MHQVMCRAWDLAVQATLFFSIQSSLAFEPLPEGLLEDGGLSTETPQLIAFLQRKARPTPDQRHIRKLVDRLGSEVFEERVAAEKELIDVGTPALEALQAARESQDAEVAARARHCVEEIERQKDLVRPAVQVLLKREPKALLPFLKSKGGGVKLLCVEEIAGQKEEGNWAVPGLLEALDDEDWRMQYEVRRALIHVHAEGDFQRVLAAAKDERLAVRTGGLWLLYWFPSHGDVVVPLLLEAARDAKPEVRRAAVDALRGFPSDPRVVQTLVAALHDPDVVNREDMRPVALEAACSLSGFGKHAKGIIPELIWAVRHGTPKEMRELGVRALARVANEDEASVPQIVALFLDLLRNDPDLEMRLTALGGFAAIGPAATEAVPELLALVRAGQGAVGKDARRLRENALYALREIGPRNVEAIDVLVEVLRDRRNDASERQRAAEALGKAGPAARQAIPVLMEARNDRDMLLRDAAAEALKQIRR